MPPLLTLIFFAVWALICVRVVCFRSTLSARTVLTYLVLGATAGPVAVSLAEKFFNEYSWSGGPTYFILINGGKQLLLLLPVLRLMTRPSWRYSSSVTDAFLAAFSIGLGYDLMSALIFSAPAQTLTGFSFMPPGMYVNATVTAAGYGWWIGTVALTVAGVRCISRNPWLSYLAGAIVLLVCATDQTLLTSAVAIPPTWWSISTLHEVIVPYFCMALLVVAVLFEWKSLKSNSAPGSFFSELQAVLPARISLRLEEARHLAARFQVGRQLDMARTSMQRNSENPEIAAVLSAVNDQFRLTQQPPASTVSVEFKQLLVRRWPYLLWLLLAFIFTLLLSLPSMQPGGASVWQWFVFTDKWAPFQLNLVATLLLAWLAWCYGTAPPASYQGVRVDEVAQFDGERTILQTILVLFLLFSIYEIPIPPPAYGFALPAPIEFVSFSSPLAIAAGLASTGNGPSDPNQGPRWVTVLLLLLCSATFMLARRADLWRSAPQAIRLQTATRHLLTALRAALAAWLSMVLFTYIQILAHQKFGASIAAYFVRHSMTSQNGNSALGLASALVSLPGILAFIWLSRWITQRLENFLLSTALFQAKTASGGAGKT